VITVSYQCGEAVNQRDPDARFAVTHGKSHFDYRLHLAVDDKTGLGCQVELTAANFA
jgi:hypothetical protein